MVLIVGPEGGLTEEELTEMLVSTLAIEDQAEDYSATLADSYFAGESRLIWEFRSRAA